MDFRFLGLNASRGAIRCSIFELRREGKCLPLGTRVRYDGLPISSEFGVVGDFDRVARWYRRPRRKQDFRLAIISAEVAPPERRMGIAEFVKSAVLAFLR